MYSVQIVLRPCPFPCKFVPELLGGEAPRKFKKKQNSTSLCQDTGNSRRLREIEGKGISPLQGEVWGSMVVTEDLEGVQSTQRPDGSTQAGLRWTSDAARESCLHIRCKTEECGASILSLMLVLPKGLKVVSVNSKCPTRALVFEITLHRENWMGNVNVCDLTQGAGVQPGPSWFLIGILFLPSPSLWLPGTALPCWSLPCPDNQTWLLTSPLSLKQGLSRLLILKNFYCK